ncbi:unnamed protein product, partial [Bubo scandiacus]
TSCLLVDLKNIRTPLVREKCVPMTLNAVPFLCSSLPDTEQEPLARKLSPPQKQLHFLGAQAAERLGALRPGEERGELGAPTPARGITADFPSKQGDTHKALPGGGPPLAPALQRRGSLPSPAPRR